MKQLVVAIALFAFASSALAVDRYVNPVNGHTYFLTSCRMLYWDAEAEAVASGGHLATIRNAYEQQWLYQTFAPLLPAGTPYNARGYWIGLYQQSGSPEPAAGWQWVGGEPTTYTSWYAGEPNNGGNWNNENVACMVLIDSFDRDWGGAWNDGDDFSGQQLGIVEVVPEPSSLFALLAGAAGLLAVKRKR